MLHELITPIPVLYTIFPQGGAFDAPADVVNSLPLGGV